MRRLRRKFPDELVVIGVHSAKFPSEQLTANIRQAVMRHGIDHPVVNDDGFRIWQSYGVEAWPTVVLIDADGNYVGSHAGEIDADAFAKVLERLIAEFDRQGKIDRRPFGFESEAAKEPARPLRHPSKLLAAGDGRLFVADTGHHRVLELALFEDGRVARLQRTFGCGREAWADGAAEEAAFHHPHGLALAGPTLYVADTDNHAVRAVDLDSGRVRTVAGTGEMGRGHPPRGGDPLATALRSPWAVLTNASELLIAMAGTHQIWVLTADGEFAPFAGNGREALVDGPLEQASFNQPSDLALSGDGDLYVADSEASAIRLVALGDGARVVTLIGKGLFEWGDVDGIGTAARLQHPTGIAFAGGVLWIADSYNHKVKWLDPETLRVETAIGTGEPGDDDGTFAEARLYEPEGISARDGRLFIADTNNHRIRAADLARGQVWTVEIEEIS